MPGRPWVTPSHIAGTPPATCAVKPNQRGITFVRLVRRQHVVVRGDDGEVGAPAAAQGRLVFGAAGSKPVREVAAGKMLALRPALVDRIDPREIGGARFATALAQAFGDFGDNRVQRAHAGTPEQRPRLTERRE
jgi:hypothetical protein